MPRVALFGGVSARAFGFTGATVEVEVLLAAGGGAAGSIVTGSIGQSGSGGAGRFFNDFMLLEIGSYVITVGAGAPAPPENGNTGQDGEATSAFGIDLPGGGGGGKPADNGRDGGSGGGGGSTSIGTTDGGAAIPGTGQPGVGFDGSGGQTGGSRGGGGGATGVGTRSNATSGPGIVSSITGIPITYCKGGLVGVTDTGQGPGSGGRSVASNGPGSAGYDGIAIVKYRGLPRGTGGVITQVGGYTIHSFGAGVHVLDLVR